MKVTKQGASVALSFLRVNDGQPGHAAHDVSVQKRALGGMGWRDGDEAYRVLRWLQGRMSPETGIDCDRYRVALASLERVAAVEATA